MLEPMQRKFSPEEAAHIAAIEAKQQGRTLDAARAAAEMSLRQWCIVQAQGSIKNAEEIFQFVTAPLKGKDET